MTAGIGSNEWVSVLTSREDGLFEGEIRLVMSILQLVPDVFSQVLREKRLGALREDGESN